MIITFYDKRLKIKQHKESFILNCVLKLFLLYKQFSGFIQYSVL